MLQLQKVIEIRIFFLKFNSYLKFKEFGGRLDAEALTQYVDAGGNVLVAGSNIIGKEDSVFFFYFIQ